MKISNIHIRLKWIALSDKVKKGVLHNHLMNWSIDEFFLRHSTKDKRGDHHKQHMHWQLISRIMHVGTTM